MVYESFENKHVQDIFLNVEKINWVLNSFKHNDGHLILRYSSVNRL